jgi:hypothetical protein
VEKLKLVGKEIIEVLYSPLKAFKKIIEKPDFRGALFVLLLVISATVTLQYIYNIKQIYENRTPENEKWTEILENQHVWGSIEPVSLDSINYKMGNNSISAIAINGTNIWLKITNIDPIDCSTETGFTELLFWINWTNDEGDRPTSAALKLFSESEDNFFEKDLINLISTNREWKNITLNVGPDQSWTLNNSPDWQKITGIEFFLSWSDSASLTMNIDGLFFRNYISPVEATGLETAITFIFFSVIFSVGTNWVIWAGIMLIVSKLFGEELGQWNVFFIIIGYAFIASVVYTLASAVIFTSLPVLKMPLDTDLQVAAFTQNWLPNLAYQVGTIILWVGEIWIAALSTIVIRLMKNINWGKAATISAIAFGLRFVLRFFFGL